MGVGSKNPFFRYDLVPLASYVVNFKSLGPKLYKFFTENDQISPVKYKSIDIWSDVQTHIFLYSALKPLKYLCSLYILHISFIGVCT